MSYYLIVCQSITYAQRIASLLNRGGVRAYIIRTPKALSPRGCSHSVRISEKSFPRAQEILADAGLRSEHIYHAAPDGAYHEAAL